MRPSLLRIFRSLIPVAVILVLLNVSHVLFEDFDDGVELFWSIVSVGISLVLLYLVLRHSARSTETAEAAAAEANARAAEAHRRLLEGIEAMNEGFALFDAEDRLILCNSRYRSIFALTDPIEPGERFEDLVRRAAANGQYADCDPANAEAWIGERLRAHRAPNATVDLHLSDGRWLRVQERCTSEGGCVGIRTDITELKRRERELMESEDRFRKLSDAALEGIVAHEDGVIVDGNRAAAELLGVPRETLGGRRVLSFIAPEHKDAIAGRIARKGEGRMEVTLVRADGTRLLAEADNRYTVLHGRAVSMVSFRDVTEQRRTEAQLRLAKDQAEAASRAKTEFLRMISHEIRTPLNGVLGMLGLLLDSPLDDQQRTYVGTARDSGEALLAILNDILDLSKMEAGRLTLEPHAFEPVGLVEGVLDLMAARAAAKGIALASAFPGGLPLRLRGDSGRLRQVLLNLIGNAVKFTDTGGVTVTVSRDDQGTQGDGRVVLRFTVADTGSGIPVEAQPRLFEEFTQADPILSRRHGGAGLGLAISRRLVGLMEGTIGFDSEPDVGSRFWLAVPLTVVEPAPVEHPPLPGRRILVVEPCALTRAALVAQVASFGAEAVGVDSPRAVPDQRFDAAIVDDIVLGNGRTAEAAIAHLSAAGIGRLVMLATVGHRLPSIGDRVSVVPRPARRDALLAVLAGCCRPAAARVAAPERVAGAETRRILVVEDSPTNQLVVAAFLRAAGYRVDVAANGLEALEAVRRHAYDVILMDIAMPEMDGLAATRALRLMPEPQGRVPVVALTADVMDADRQRCADAGMDDHLPKPIDRARLLETVARWLPPAPATAPPAGAGVLDTEVLAQLARDLDPVMLRDVIAQFIDETLTRADRIATDPVDPSILLKEAHTLKSTADTFGARVLAALARDLEAACRAGAGSQGVLRHRIPAAAQDAAEALRRSGYAG